MFESPQEAKQTTMTGLWIGVSVALVALAGGVLLYRASNTSVPSQNEGKPPELASGSAPHATADPVHDLKVLSVRMDKDRAGTTAVWLVDITNRSRVYTYSNIQYETTYVGADNRALLINKGTIAGILQPGDGRNSEFRDVLYPVGTAWYKFRITGATSSAQ
jgi:hypothetical protein